MIYPHICFIILSLSIVHLIYTANAQAFKVDKCDFENEYLDRFNVTRNPKYVNKEDDPCLHQYSKGYCCFHRRIRLPTCCLYNGFSYQYRWGFWNMWYFWFAILVIMISCFGGFGYRYRQRNNICWLYSLHKRDRQTRLDGRACSTRAGATTLYPYCRDEREPHGRNIMMHIDQNFPYNSAIRYQPQGNFSNHPPEYSEAIKTSATIPPPTFPSDAFAADTMTQPPPPYYAFSSNEVQQEFVPPTSRTMAATESSITNGTTSMTPTEATTTNLNDRDNNNNDGVLNNNNNTHQSSVDVSRNANHETTDRIQ